MKRIVILIVLCGLAVGARGQCDSTARECSSPHSLQLGLAAGVNLYSNVFDDTPYYSTHGLFAQVPLVYRYRVSPHWALGGGLQYDFCFDPLHYAVKEDVENGGLDFESAPFAGTQTAFIIHNYLGIPLNAEWIPNPSEPQLLRVTFDLYVGYSFATGAIIHNKEAYRTVSGSGGSFIGGGGIDAGAGYDVVDNASMRPLRLEMGVTLATDVLGLVHGVRFFANLLPNYHDQITGDAIRNFGMSIYL